MSDVTMDAALPPWGGWVDDRFEEIYAATIKAAVLHRQLLSDYPNDDDEEREENYPRTEQWHSLMSKAESLLNEDIEPGILCEVEPDWTREQLFTLLSDNGAWD
jgi:hypothetical protein